MMVTVRAGVVLTLPLFATLVFAQGKEKPMQHHAHGTFTVKVAPLTPGPAEGLSRYSLEKEIHGDIEGTSKGEMMGGGDVKSGVAGYVAVERISGTLNGRHGSFALQHSSTMDINGQKMNIIVVPGSGTDELKGITGTFTIRIENGQHLYDFDYTLPDQP